MRKAAAILSALMLIAGAARPYAAPLPALPGLGREGAYRDLVDVNSYPWRILGRVQTALGTKCTGFAVAPTVVMTAAHCLWLPATGHYIQPRDVHVLMGYVRGSYRTHAQVRRIIVAPGYDPANESATASVDRATLILDRPVVKTDDLLSPVAVKGNESVMLVGYPQDRAEVPYGDVDCHLNGLTIGGLIHHDCAATHGDSGSPLLVRQPDGSWKIGGLAVLAQEGAGGFAAPLMPPVMH
ncbi:trypsin-like serine peptidase [Gluconobacter morbifer]|uniref:Serine protease n=1 Tax=Gluconobacter morbifer G707 TaxID=1088869 RepID=G6XGN6_9PROT|nr:trypsin-like serine protease [Gluconobacter morbifer]EHH69344.1 putative protease [Gluconobacter morbifer G707]